MSLIDQRTNLNGMNGSMSASISSNMSSSMTGNNLIDSATAASSESSQLYQRAAKLFLTKQFAQSYEQLQELMARSQNLLRLGDMSYNTWTKSWKLYFVLADKAIKDESGSCWPASVRKDLLKRTHDGVFWDKLDSEFGGLDRVPPDVAHGLVSLVVRNCVSSETNAKKLEEYLSVYDEENLNGLSNNSADEYSRILDAYVLHVLPARGEWEYAKQMAEMSTFYSDDTKDAIAKRLTTMEREEIEREKEEKRMKEQRAKEQEKERKRAEKEQQQREKNGRTESTESVASAADHSTKEEQVKELSTERNRSPRAVKDSTSNSSITRLSGMASVAQYWKNKSMQLVQSIPLTRYILFLAVIALSASNPLIRAKVIEMLRRLWQKFAETARMGLKVSFI